ncbi:hypothetical protein CVT25_012077 [Psilocybe cyanescens]|uniref:Right handed beta helix domain-containing protein n=1 Tax=Psilocybe cyanescens TaxID=93625 RepID=A0A409VMV4_PSICY|nr:hypothetical protein CVT25_012077 [Psilocybe cyanescens]
MANFLTRRISHALLKRHSDAQIAGRADGNCEPADPANTVTDRLNNLLQNSGDGFVLSLCPSQTYMIQAPILFAHPNQEISTVGYPTDDKRAVLSVAGPVMNGQGHTTAVDGTCGTCSGVKLRNVQIDGARRGGSPTGGGGNIEMGGGNSNQLIEFVRSWDPRSWSCLHIAEGPLSCSGTIIQNNDIGPCGSDVFQQWADGISVSCRDSVVRNNMIQDPTDGGIVVFGSPGTQVYNNTIWILNATLLGGINLVDYDPWSGDFTDTVVRNNVILGGFATDKPDNDAKGNNFENAIIKIGIAIGPKTWFGDRYGNNVVKNGVVRDNRLSGAFSYGIAATSATNFTIQGNVMFGNTSFIGARGPLCTDTDVVPTPGPFILDPSTTTAMSVQSDFQLSNAADAFTCVLPPNGGDFWPFGLNPSNASSATTGTSGMNGTKSSSSNTAGVAVGVVVSVVATGIIAWFVRKKFIARREAAQHFNATKRAEYTEKI